MEKLKILLVEDDEFAAELIYNYFLDYGFSITFTFNALDSFEKLENETFDIVILDINLPDMNGFEVLKNIQSRSNTTPVMIISAYNDKSVKLRAFKYGASDYMVKPIDLEELEARIWVHLRKESVSINQNKREAKRVFEIRDLFILFHNKKLDLTSIEQEILRYLITHKNQVVKRDELCSVLSTVSTERSLDNHIKNIRKKLGEDAKNAQYLKTVYGVGYFFNL